VLGHATAPAWLAVDDVLSSFAAQRDLAQERYRTFVNSAIGNHRRVFDDVKGQMYLGSDTWIDEVRDKIALKPRSDNHPRLQRDPKPVPMADVVSSVACACSTTAEIVRRGHGGTPRSVAAWVGCHEALLTNREIAAGLRLRSVARVTQLIQECDISLSSNAAVRDAVDRTISTLRRKN
jgi:hypothetical protein